MKGFLVSAIEKIESLVPDTAKDMNIRVLIVDDSRLQRKIISASLLRRGYDVREADSGVSALTVCAEWPPDVVLSDWMMPEMDGLEFCQKSKRFRT